MSRENFNNLARIAITLACIAGITLSYGCGRNVRLVVERADKEAPQVDSSGVIISDQNFLVAPQQLNSNLISLEFYPGKISNDFVLQDDDIFLLDDSGAFGFHMRSNNDMINFSAIGSVYTPGKCSLIRSDGETTSVLFEDTWYSSKFEWLQTNIPATPDWQPGAVIPDGVISVLHPTDDWVFYILDDNRIVLDNFGTYYQSDAFSGAITAAIMVDDDKLITSTEDKGIFLDYPANRISKVTRVKIADVKHPKCLLFDNGSLLVGCEDGALHLFKKPESWREKKEWGETSKLNTTGPINGIALYQYKGQSLYIVTHTEGSWEGAGVDESGALVSCGDFGMKFSNRESSEGKCTKSAIYKGTSLILVEGKGLFDTFMTSFNMGPAEIKSPNKPISNSASPAGGAVWRNSIDAKDAFAKLDPVTSISELWVFDKKLACAGYQAMVVYDVSDPARPVLENMYPIERASNGALFQEPPGLFAASKGSSSVCIYDLKSPMGDMPKIVSEIRLKTSDNYVQLFEAGRILLICYHSRDVDFYNITNPSKPDFIGNLEGEIIDPAYNHEWVGYYKGLFYLPYSNVINVVNPFTDYGPSIIRKLRLGDFGGTDACLMQDDYILSMHEDRENWLRKLTDDGWESVSADPPTSNKDGWKRINDTLAFSERLKGFGIFDISNPLSITYITGVEGLSITDAELINGYIYCATVKEGLQVFKAKN